MLEQYDNVCAVHVLSSLPPLDIYNEAQQESNAT